METVALFILCCLTVSLTGASISLAGPDNVTVAVGGIATFKCAFNEHTECDNVAWVFSKSGCDSDSYSTIGQCRKPVSNPSMDTTGFSFSFNNNSSQFQISSVQFSDAGMYACWLTDINTFSNCAHMQVVNPPTPVCSTPSESAVVGDSVSLNCKLPEESVISTKLTWHTPKIATRNNVDPGSSHTVHLVLKETDNYKKFMCVAGNPTEGPNCTVTPLQIDMNVSVSFLEFDAQDSSVRFECVAGAVPEATEFDWAVKIGFLNDTDQTWVDVLNESRRRFELTSDQLTVYNLTERDDGLQVRCTAHNDIGMNKTSEPATVLRCLDGRLVTWKINECISPGQTFNGALTFPIALTISIFSAFLLVIVIVRKKKKYTVIENNSPATPHISSSLDREPTNEASDDRSPNHYSPTDNARVDSETTTVTVPQVESPVQEVGDTNRPTELQVPDYKSIGEYSTPVIGVQHPLEHTESSAEEASQPASPDPKKVTPYGSLDSVKIKTNSGSSTRSTRPKVPLKTQLLKSKLTGRVPPTPLGNKAGMPITLPCYMTVGEVGLGGSCHLDKSDKAREVDELDSYETISYQTM